MSSPKTNPKTKATKLLSIQGKDGTKAQELSYYPLSESENSFELAHLPYSIRVLLEAAIRKYDGVCITQKDIDHIREWKAKDTNRPEIPFHPSRVILQDFTGVPAVVDLAALRSALERNGGDPSRINPQVQVDLVIDHSIQVDHFGNSTALEKNMEREFDRNQERYSFLKWGEQAFDNFRIIPPGVGIVHQINLEYLAKVVLSQDGIAYPDSLIGTDSHTTMINSLGVLGWGVGGIEAEAVMLGQPIYMLLPDVVGVQLQGIPPCGVTATDIVLQITETLRFHGVVGKFVEFVGEGISHLSLPDRATIANMAPEYGATCGFFPVDEETLRYLRQTGRSEEQIELVRAYSKEQGIFLSHSSPIPEYTKIIEIELSKVEPSLAGPKRPQDRISVSHLKPEWKKILHAPKEKDGFGISENSLDKNSLNGSSQSSQKCLHHGDIVIAAITSCTNTSNHGVMIAAGLLAKKAVEAGLSIPSHVKTSLAPGSRVVSSYLEKCGLNVFLDQLGFHTVGYGCTTCIGNSGPLPQEIIEWIQEKKIIAVSILSGNRNFEGRISPHVKANFLASPPLVIAYALYGNIEIDLSSEPLGKGSNGSLIYLKDIWPSEEEIKEMSEKNISPEMYLHTYQNVSKANQKWNEIPYKGEEIYKWQKDSTYIQEPSFFQNMPKELPNLQAKNILKARCLVKVGDSITTDHISPAGAIPEDMPAGKYLLEQGVSLKDFNSFGSRRGNDRVMTRGTFGNIRLKNQIALEREGGWTKHQPSNELMTIYDASLRYKKEGIPLIVIAGEGYGTGSSRDWAAKGTYSLDCKAVIASSYERIHRSNLVGMGVLPLEFLPGETHQSLGLSGKEEYSIEELNDDLAPQAKLQVQADQKTFWVLCRLDTFVEIEYYKNGGILHTVLRKLLS